MRDVSNWKVIGFGENSTLAKQELLSDDGTIYVIKFPRELKSLNNSEMRTNWEDYNEMVAAGIAKRLNLSVVDVEMATKNGRRGCLMKHFGQQNSSDMRETVAALLTSEFDHYQAIEHSALPNKERMSKLLECFYESSYYNDEIRSFFVKMNLFDILIGNQDRHGHNWQILFIKSSYFMAPLYDNGASLGWQIPDERLHDILNDETKMHNLYRKTLLKIGLDNKPTPKIKVSTILNELINRHKAICVEFMSLLENMDTVEFEEYCSNLPLISDVRKQFIFSYVMYRRERLLEIWKGAQNEYN